MRKFFLSLILIGLPVAIQAVQTPIYPVLTDKGSAGEDIYIWGGTVSLDSTTVNPAPPEGLRSMKAVMTGTGATWAIMYLNKTTTPISNRPVDLSAYSNGEIRLWLNCDSDQFNLDIQHADESTDGYYFGGQLNGQLNRWVPVVLPLGPITQSFPINDIVSPFEMVSTQIAPLTCYVDNVRYVDSSASPIFNVTVKDIRDQNTVTDLTWGSPSLPTGWVRSEQYIELDTDSQAAGWGVQIYTDNTNPTSANPKFVSSVPVGKAGSNPAGLVDELNPDRVLPVAWSIKATLDIVEETSTVPANPPKAVEPNHNGLNGQPLDINAFQWLYLQDLHTPAIVEPPTQAFKNGDQDPFVMVRSHLGNHFGQNDTEFGAENSPSYIFFEANFSQAVTPRTYQTNTLTLEFFYQ